MYTVDAGHMSLKYSRLSGVGNGTYREGVHFLLPWLERPIIFDVRARPHTMTSLTGSRDLQMVNISLRALCKPDASKLPDIYRSLGLDFDEKVLPSIINEVLKSVVAQYNASQLITQRELVSRMIRQRLIQRAFEFGILLDDVAITHLNFSPEYEKADSYACPECHRAIHLWSVFNQERHSNNPKSSVKQQPKKSGAGGKFTMGKAGDEGLNYAEERRVDPEDGMAYTWDELVEACSEAVDSSLMFALMRVV
eukprot:symbB.v1.2.023539.t2/scaffold2159.1/size105835/7